MNGVMMQLDIWQDDTMTKFHTLAITLNNTTMKMSDEYNSTYYHANFSIWYIEEISLIFISRKCLLSPNRISW